MRRLFGEPYREQYYAGMYIDFSALFHRSSKDHTDKGAVRIATDSQDWPKEWKTTYYKSYGNLPQIVLPLEPHKADFFELIENRHSSRDFTGTPVGLEKLSAHLKYSCGIVREGDGYAARAQPSGGARFPLEVYALVFSGNTSLPAGVYHYSVREHALDVLTERSFSKKDIATLFAYDWIQEASGAIIITSNFWRNQIKYGERGYRYVLLEAGHIGQNVYLASQALGLGCCAMGGSRDEAIEKLLDIDGISESLVHTVILGEAGSATMK